MKSVKPGRGPSMMGAIVAIAMAVFGILWVVAASDITSEFPSVSSYGGEFVFESEDIIGGYSSPFDSFGGIFPLFGVVFVIIAIAMAVYHFMNATGKNRYSSFDIVDDEEEPDPLNERFGERRHASETEEHADTPAFCPYCGNDLKSDHIYCERCGKKVK